MRSQGRPLTEGERNLAAAMFGRAIDYEQVRIHAAKWWPFQPRRVAMSPDGHLWFHPEGGLFKDDYSTCPLGDQGLFIHEMTHVWQHQRGVWLPLARHPFCRYDYSIKPGWELTRYGLEQQAEIVRHTFLLRQGAHVRGAPSLQQYETILPF
ncbi:vgr related protein [Sphingomonas sp. ID1715]|uniref:vgr related protein n=1 Tax=Sphingomonas sp. ID1715 TaxID=1656898 RepID=UPI001489F6FB|nr:vgr related protein [Sphingomonas sp. ID1715]NNM75777.1 vgr related protein [Sphingomonas sp. ID1715]